MSFLTIFTAPKPFTQPLIRAIQRNAIRSWMQLKDVSVVLVGQEPGLAETAAEFGLLHLPDVRRNEKGTPLVSSVFSLAHQATDSPLLAYVNADMLLLPELLQAVRQVQALRSNFLLVCQRWNLDITEELVFEGDWAERLRTRALTQGEFYTPWGVDLFVFPRSQYLQVPDFAIGRPAWDNWMLYHAREQGWTTVDATRSLVIVHQNHDYSHLPGNKPPYGSEEAIRNTSLAGGKSRKFNIMDTERELIRGRLRKPRWSPGRLFRWLERALVTDGMGSYRAKMARIMNRWATRWGSVPRPPVPFDKPTRQART